MSSEVIHEFVTLFRGDTSDLEKGERRANQTGKELETTLTNIDKKANKAGDGFFSFAQRAAGALASIFGLRAMAGSITEMAALNDEVGDLTESLGQNAQEVQAWGNATVHWGGSVKQFQNTLVGVNEQLNMFATTGHSRAAPFFQKLGISMVDAKGKARDFMEILPELAKKTEGMSKRESAGMLGKMGIDQATIMMIQRGSREVEELVKRQKELGVASKEDIEIAGKYSDAMDDLHHVIKSPLSPMAVSAIVIASGSIESPSSANCDNVMPWGNVFDAIKRMRNP